MTNLLYFLMLIQRNKGTAQCICAGGIIFILFWMLPKNEWSDEYIRSRPAELVEAFAA